MIDQGSSNLAYAYSISLRREYKYSPARYRSLTLGWVKLRYELGLVVLLRRLELRSLIRQTAGVELSEEGVVRLGVDLVEAASLLGERFELRGNIGMLRKPGLQC